MNKLITNLKEKFDFKLINLIPYIAGSALFIITPLIMLIVKASASSPLIDKGELLANPDMWHAIRRSIIMALVAAMFCLLIAFPFTWIIARSKSQTFRILSIALVISPIFIFSVVKVFSLKILLMNIYDTNELPPKQWIIVLGMVYLYTPYMIIPLYSVMRSFPTSLLDASSDLGYGPIKTMFKVILPYCSKAIFSGLAIVFMIATTTLVMSTTLIDNGTSIDSTRMIANVIEETSKGINHSTYAEIKTSTISLITLAVVMAIYALIYITPIIIQKIRGGINV